MNIVKVGVNFQRTPLHIREKLSFTENTIGEAMCALATSEVITGNVILSTCNRTEIYAVVKSVEEGYQEIYQFLKDWFEINNDKVDKYLQFEHGEEVVFHLFKLSVGLDSMVLGETQILGQVRNAFLTAQQLKVTGKVLNELFKRVITFAKSAHNKTIIGEKAVSISYVAVELTKKIFGQMKGKNAVIIGAGEMGELALQNISSSGVSEITVVNRSLDRAELLAIRFNAKAATFEDLERVLMDANIVISSTGASESVLTKELLQEVQKQRNYKKLFLIDIAVPRDVSSNVAELKNVFLYDIDDLQNVADENMEARKKAALLIEAEIIHELTNFQKWLAMLDVVPLIKGLQEKSFNIQERTLESIFRKMPGLDEREKKVIRKHTQSIVNQLIAQPINQVKRLGETGNTEILKLVFPEIFGLELQTEDSTNKGEIEHA